MKRYVYIMLLLSGTFVATGHAQITKETGSDDFQKIERIVKKNLDLVEKESNLVNLKKDLEKKSKDLSKVHDDLKKEIGGLQKDIEDLKKDKKYQHYLALTRQRDSLNRVIQDKNEQIKNDSIYLSAHKDALKQRTEHNANLDKIKDGVSQKVTAEISDYLNKPFSDMKLEELERFKANYKIYNDAPGIKKALAKVDQVTKQKKFFDEMERTVKSRYDKVNVEKMYTQSMYTFKDLNPAQNQEIQNIRKQLNDFKIGLEKFKQLLNDFEHTRDVTDYSKNFDADWKRYLNGVTHRGVTKPGHNIDEIKAVPYLKTKLEAWVKACRHDDTKTRAAIEDEIKCQIPNEPQ